MTIDDIARRIAQGLSAKLDSCGIMYRLFWRGKSTTSLAHKMQIKGEKYRSGINKIQDMIGLRIVVYFSDDVDVLNYFLNDKRVVSRSVDEPDSCTFKPQRLNLTSMLPVDLIDDFRATLPNEYAEYIDNTYEIQIRTIFSEGWHEVEHDMRYKCKEEWIGHEDLSRQLNGVIASLEMAEWSMQTIFANMAQRNFAEKNYTAMIRNQLRLRVKGNGLSKRLTEYLTKHPESVKAIMNIDRVVFLLALLYHDKHIELTYDNLLHLMNRIEIRDKELMNLENDVQRNEINAMLHS